ncbi:hypothetical protein [Thalassobaculum sp.]|uniref:hypothetical protein n=1 Tax=Thalassobaculum sp. TaxID=2022740 RepID=UPI0032EDD29D
MSLLKDVLAELLGMFLADLRLSIAVLLLVGLVALLVDRAVVDPLVGGGMLLAGCLTILATVTAAAARRR